jgi:general secretion pathway protein D
MDHQQFSPETWEDVGGPGAISYFDTNMSLVVSQTEEVHRQIEKYLAERRAQRAQEKEPESN